MIHGVLGFWGFGVLGVFGGTENGTSGARIKNLRPLFNMNTPPKTPISHFLTSRSAQIKKISKETHLKIQIYIEKHVSQLF